MSKKTDIEAIYYLSPLQQGLLFHAVSEGNADPYFTQTSFRLRGQLDPTCFAQAWQTLVERHQVLRTTFVWEGVAKPVQVVKRVAHLPIAHLDWRGRTQEEQAREMAAFLAHDRQLGFDRLQAPLMRLTVVRVGEKDWNFINSHHHLLLDGWSFARLLREAFILYHALMARAELPPPTRTSYGDYLRWVAGRNEDEAQRFWRAEMQGFSDPHALPYAASPVPIDHHVELPFGECELRLSASESQTLNGHARRQRITLNTLIQGAWGLLLRKHTGMDEVVFGATVAGRPTELVDADAIVGMLINTLPMRVRMPADMPLSTWLAALQQKSSAVREFEWTALPQIQRWSDVPSGQPLFESIVVFDSYPEEEIDHSPLELEIHAMPRASQRVNDEVLSAGRNNYPLSLIVEPTREIKFALCYARSRFESAQARALLEHFATLLRAMVAQPFVHLAALSCLDEKSQKQMIETWNDTAVAWDTDGCVHEWIAAQARANPDTLAVVDERSAITYRELDARGNQLARHLQALGVRAERRVGLCFERSTDFVIALVGVLKAGAAYVPIDPNYPPARQRAILADSGACALVYRYAEHELLRDLPCEAVSFERDAAAIATYSSTPLGPTARAANLAYLIYTSGSTGQPKGVAVEHRQLVNYVAGVLAKLPRDHLQSFALVSTVAADLGHTSLFGALCSGRTLHVLANDRTFDPDRMAAYLREHPVDAMKIVPTHLAALLEAADPVHVLPKRCLILGGESARAELLARVRQLAPACEIINHYGPTETTVGALTWQVYPACEHGDGLLRNPPIGRPLANLRAYVLDHDLQPVPVGVVGELCLGGAGVSRGYHGHPAASAQKFMPDPFSQTPGARLYRTGDRTRQRPDGSIEFLGRRDAQVKIRGHRIELGEVEAALVAHPEVDQAVVIARTEATGARLVAYVTAREGHSLQSDEVRRTLAATLPEFMVPSELVRLDAIPLTANGKIDRQALPSPEQAGGQARGFVAPRTPAELELAAIWADVLARQPIGVFDNFFSLGGDSIRSLQVIARARQRGIELTPKDLFEHPTIADAIAVASGRQSKRTAIKPCVVPTDFSLSGLSPAQISARWPDTSAIADVYPLSPMQEGMLFHTLLSPHSGIYLMQQHYTWNGALDPDLLAAAWMDVTQLHPILRTSFVWQDLERPLQVVHRQVNLADFFHVLDLRELDASQQESHLRGVLDAELSQGLDLARAPLLRLRLVRTADDVYQIVRSFHHILTDDWCFSLLMMQCLSFYAARKAGKPLTLPNARPYRDYIAWLGRQDLAQAEAFWRQELQGFRAPTPLGIEHHVADEAGVDTIGDVFTELSQTASDALFALAKEHGLTPNTFVQAAWALLLGRYSGHHEVVFGVTVAGRPTDLPEVESIVGLFINSLPLRVSLPPQQPLIAWLKELLATNYRIRQYEYPPLVQIQQWSEVAKGQALFKSLVVFENAPLDPRLGEQVGDVHLGFENDRVHTNYPITVVAYPGAKLGMRLSYDRRVVGDDAMQSMIGHLEALLHDMVARPHARLTDFEIVTAGERQRLLGECQANVGSAPPAATYVALFEAQVDRTPHARAVTSGERELSYAALNGEANRLAHALRAEDVQDDSIVAVLEARDIELVVAVLGVLKAGGAYLPLDPAAPAQRLTHVLASSGARVVLTSQALAAHLHQALKPLSESSRPRVVVRENVRPALSPNLLSTTKPDHLAYIIYTSGSTGVPKGAMVHHAGMLNNVWGKVPALELNPRDVIGQTASQCFDISVWQMLSGLLCGARVHVVKDEIVGDPSRLLDEVRTQGITVLELVPSLLRELVAPHVAAPVAQAAQQAQNEQNRAASLRSLRWMLPTGEALSAELCRRWFACYPLVPLVNAYGPAECADDVALHVIRQAPAANEVQVPIGKAVPNVALHIVSADHLTPFGVTGELHVAGVGVGRGYLNDPRRTAQAFVPDPFSLTAGARMYKTGDLARRRSDGALEFCGRRDHQVKIRGFRIELGEIEARLDEHPSVRECAVIVHENDSGQRLVAYVARVESGMGHSQARESLREHLAAVLPEYMVPAIFVFLAELPHSLNGKIERQALPAPQNLSTTSESSAVHSPIEQVVAGIWSAILGVIDVDTHANFFELGGHSLLATQVMSRVNRDLSVELPLRALFDHPTVAGLARQVQTSLQVRKCGTALPPITRHESSEPLPLSFAQQRVWFVEQLRGEEGLFTIPFAIGLKGALQVEALRASCEALIDRHQILRTSFVNVRGEPFQIVQPTPTFEVPIVDVLQLAQHLQIPHDRAIDHAMGLFFAGRFDLQNGPLLRAQVLKIGEEHHIFVVALHHIAADGWSLNLLVEDLSAQYSDRVSTQPMLARQPLALHYTDFAVWQRQRISEAWYTQQLNYWREQLSDGPYDLCLPGMAPGGEHERKVARLRRDLTLELSQALQRRANQQGLTLFMVLYAALNVVIHQQTQASDILIGTDVANRHYPATEEMVGFFVNQLVLRCKLTRELRLSELLRQCRQVALDAYQNQDLPFDTLVAALAPQRNHGRAPLFRHKLILQNTKQTELALPGLVVQEFDHEPRDVESDVLIMVSTGADDALHLVIDFRADLYAPAFMQLFGELYEHALCLVVQTNDVVLADIVDALHEHHENLKAQAQAHAQTLHVEHRKKMAKAQRKPVGA